MIGPRRSGTLSADRRGTSLNVQMIAVSRLSLAITLTLCLGTTAYAQKTDVVTLGNGDRITGEIKNLERGRLEFSTDDAGTLYLEWDKLSTLVTKRRMEVLTSDGTRFLGPLITSVNRSITVVTQDGERPLPMTSVTLITPIGMSFLRRIDGSIDAGYSYTRSSGIAQLNVNSDTVYRKPASRVRLMASLTQTTNEDGEGRDDRGSIELSILKYPWHRWFVTGGGRFESNESLGLELRSQGAGAIGPRLINSNRAQTVVGAGLAFNDERGVDVEATQNLEMMFTLGSSFYTYDRPQTSFSLNLQYYASLSNWGRNRIQLDTSAKRELWKDLYLSGTLYNSYDSRPPNPEANTNDIGFVLSIGWTY
jgi:hypothetical protein